MIFQKEKYNSNFINRMDLINKHCYMVILFYFIFLKYCMENKKECNCFIIRLIINKNTENILKNQTYL